MASRGGTGMSVLSKHMIEKKRYYLVVITCLVVVISYYVFFSKTENAIDFQNKTSAQKPLILEHGIQEEIPTLYTGNVPLLFEKNSVTSNIEMQNSVTSNMEMQNTENAIPISVSEPEFSVEEQRIYLEKLNLSQNLARQGKWLEFIALNNELSMAGPESLTHGLVLTIQNDAPIDIIVSLLNQGAELDFVILKVLISKQNLPLIKTFVEFGLDVHMTDNQGESTIEYASKFANNTEIIDYFISIGVKETPNSSGL
jgi:hypothetical protein